MDTVATRLQETGTLLARHHHTFVARTREAGLAFLGETRDASRQLVAAFQSEGRRWRRYATLRTTQLRADASGVLTLPAVERSVLATLDSTLRGLDTRVRARLAALEPAAKPARAKRRKATARSRRTRQTLPAIAA